MTGARYRISIQELLHPRNYVRSMQPICKKNNFDSELSAIFLAYVHFLLYLCMFFRACTIARARGTRYGRMKQTLITKSIMIEYIKGNLTDLNPTYAVIEAAGVGYAINIALPTYSSLVGKENTEAKLFITEIIREDTHELYGFFTRGERELFLMLMTVSGIGANTARMIMSAYSASEIRQIIATGNSRALAQVKGLGPKTAQRIIVDLKDKVLKVDLGADDQSGAMVLDLGVAPVADSAVKQEAVSALTMLGFAAAASGKVVDKILKADPSASVEQVIKQALKML